VEGLTQDILMGCDDLREWWWSSCQWRR